MYTNEAIATFLPTRDLDVQYLYWAAPIYIPQNAIENIYGAKLLNRDRIANAPLSASPLEEQRAIAAFLDRETAKIDALTAKVREGIERLKEYRTALISAVVTGKIDVREGVVIPAQAGIQEADQHEREPTGPRLSPGWRGRIA